MALENTIGALIKKEGRKTVEERVINKVHNDQNFAAELKNNPTPSLEKFLDIRIPEIVNINLFFEDAHDFSFVIPIKGLVKEDAKDSNPLTVSDVSSLSKQNIIDSFNKKENQNTVKDIIIAKAQEDYAFALKLQQTPVETLEKFLGISIPKETKINAIFDGTRSFSVVIPNKI